eukprot:EST43018.1 Ankyrin repeat-containing protein [Spironucleus salmonicida]
MQRQPIGNQSTNPYQRSVRKSAISYHSFRKQVNLTPQTSVFEESNPFFIALMNGERESLQRFSNHTHNGVPIKFINVFLLAPKLLSMTKYYDQAKVRDCTGKSILFYAISGGIHLKYKQNFDILKLTFSCQDRSGMTALMLASYLGHPDISFLIPYEAGFKDMQGRSALFYAIIARRMNIVLQLLQYEFETVDSNQKGVYDYFEHYGLSTEILITSGIERHLFDPKKNQKRSSRKESKIVF